MDDSRNVTEDGQEDVDKQVGAAATLEEDAERGQDDGDDDLDDVAEGPVSVCATYDRGCAAVGCAASLPERAGKNLRSGKRHVDGW